jgi:hypothetical protein
MSAQESCATEEFNEEQDCCLFAKFEFRSGEEE